MAEFIENLRSLSFGAMLGAGISGLIFVLFPAFSPATTTLKPILIIGGLLGGGAHRLIDAWFIRSFFRPVGRFLTYYSKLVQLKLLSGLIEPEQRRELMRDLTYEYFLDRPFNGSRQQKTLKHKQGR